MKQLRRIFTHRRGSFAIEAAFALPVLLMMIFGTIEFSYVMWARGQLGMAVEETGRWVVVEKGNGRNPDSGQIGAHLDNSLIALDPADVNVTVTPAVSPNGTNYRVITATYTYTFFTASLLGVTQTLPVSRTVSVPN